MSVVREGFGIGGAGVDGSYAAGVVVLLRASRPRSQGVVLRAGRACCWCGGFVLRAGRPRSQGVVWRAGRPRSQGVVWWASWACCWCGGTVAGGLGVLLVGVSVGAGHARDCGFAASKALLSLN